RGRGAFAPARAGRHANPGAGSLLHRRRAEDARPRRHVGHPRSRQAQGHRPRRAGQSPRHLLPGSGRVPVTEPERSKNNSPSPAAMLSFGMGVVNLYIAVVESVLTFGLMALNLRETQEGWFGGKVGGGLCGCAFFLSFIGFFLGMFGGSKPGRGRVFGILGMVFNGLICFGTVFVMGTLIVLYNRR